MKEKSNKKRTIDLIENTPTPCTFYSLFCLTDLRIGYLEQEPRLDPDKTVRENVLEGVAEKITALERFEELEQKEHKVCFFSVFLYSSEILLRFFVLRVMRRKRN